jgi:hypothetical protein
LGPRNGGIQSGGRSMTIAVGELKMEASRSGWGCLGDWGQEEDKGRTEWCWLGGEDRINRYSLPEGI